MTKATKNREAWLQDATSAIRKEVFEAVKLTLPPVNVSVGFPSKSALSASQRVIGECWQFSTSDDKVAQIFITPLLSDVKAVLGTLAHELLHAYTPGEGHKGAFKKLMPLIGLEGKPTQALPGAELAKKLERIAEKIGPYPHAKLNAGTKIKTQGTRLLKVECPECGYLVRTTAKWLEVGMPSCPEGTEMMVSL